MLTTKTKADVFKACVFSTLLYDSQAWTLYTRQERRLNTFHMRCLRKIQGITWQERTPNKNVLAKAGMQSLFALLSKRRLSWLGHVRRMVDGRIPKDTLYVELASGTRPTGRPILRFKDVCKRDIKKGSINPANSEMQAADRIRTCIRTSARQRQEQWEEKREPKKQMAETTAEPGAKTFKYSNCNRVCGTRI